MKHEHIDRLVKELQRHGARDVGVEYGGKHPRINFTHEGQRRFYVTPLTPSDHRSGMNSLADLRRILGVTRNGPREPTIELPPPEEAPQRTEEFLQGYARGVEEGESRHRKQHAREVSALRQQLEAAGASSRQAMIAAVTAAASEPAKAKCPALIANGESIGLELPEEEEESRATLYLTACLLLWSTNPHRASEIIDEFFGDEEEEEERHAA